MLERFAKSLGCEWGAYWKWIHRRSDCEPAPVGPLRGLKGQRGEQQARVRALASNQGNAGQAWRTRKPIWTTNLVLDMCLPHSLGVSEAELRGGVWFAVKTDTAIYGVIELLARKLPYKSPEALRAVERAGLRVGFVLEEIRGEPAPLH